MLQEIAVTSIYAAVISEIESWQFYLQQYYFLRLSEKTSPVFG